jgi:hypothetical protein
MYRIGGLATAFCMLLYLIVGTAWLWLVLDW